MDKSRIDTTFFKLYSTHSAAVSKEASCGTSSLERVLKMGNWHGTSAFFKFYLRHVKYFKCAKETQGGTSKITEISYDNDSIHHVHCKLATSSTIRCRANHSLRHALSHAQARNLPPILTDLPAAQQDLINCGEFDSSFTSSRGTSGLPSDMSSIPPSPCPSTSDHMLQPRILSLVASTPVQQKKCIKTISAMQARNIFTPLLAPQPSIGRKILPNMENVKVRAHF